MNTTHQRLATSCGFISMMVFLAAMIIMDFIPPPSPSLSPEAVAAIYQSRALPIRFGALLMVFSAFFYAPFAAVMYLQLRRMEGAARSTPPIRSMTSPGC